MQSIKNKISRKSFFATTALAGIGFALLKFPPLRFFKSSESDKKIQVKINPLAVSRKK